LAFNGKERTQERSRTNRMRKLLWDEIHSITFAVFGANSDERRRVTPTRRGETSGFVVRNKP
jgi:NifB/MoaA-like Fe-S oxidoreductase